MVQWDEEIVFNDGDAFFDNIFAAIAGAKHSIKIETYIFDLDDLGNKILQALGDAADREVSVMLLLDGAGCSEWNFEIAKKFRKKNFEIQFFHPLLWQRKSSSFWSYFNLLKLTRGFSLLNHRNHRKVFLIDDDVAYLGSMNVSQLHLKSMVDTKAWRDSGVKIKGEIVKVLHESFADARSHNANYLVRYLKKNKPITDGMPLLMLNRTISQRRQTYHYLLQRLCSAKSHIYITNPYFIPTSRIGDILKIAARNGVKVIALFPSKSDIFPVKLAMEGLYVYLLNIGVQIYEYQPSMIHAKILIVDDHITIGSSNMNSRSLLLDLEVDVEITHPDNIQLIKNHFFEDLAQSKKIELSDWKKRSWINKLLEKLFFCFRWVI